MTQKPFFEPFFKTFFKTFCKTFFKTFFKNPFFKPINFPPVPNDYFSAYLNSDSQFFRHGPTGHRRSFRTNKSPVSFFWPKPKYDWLRKQLESPQKPRSQLRVLFLFGHSYSFLTPMLEDWID